MPFVATIRAVLWTIAFCEGTNGAMPCGKRLTVGTLHIYCVNRQLYVQQNGAYRPLMRVRCVSPQFPAQIISVTLSICACASVSTREWRHSRTPSRAFAGWTYSLTQRMLKPLARL